MKKIIIGIITLVFLNSCGNSKSKIDPFASLTNLVDSASNRNDSVNEQSGDTLIPPQVDESFADFIYNFASDTKIQNQRINFPLHFYNNNSSSKIEKRFWKQDPLFIHQNYYTMIFDKESDMDKIKELDPKSIQFEWIYMKTRMVKKYYFQRVKGAWMLEAINLHNLDSHESENFIDFFHRFTTDSVFMCERTRQPLAFVTTDPDDDFSILETTLEINQWLAFKPQLPQDKLSNINYGQSNNDNSNTKIVSLIGIGNGFSNLLYFQRKGHEWELYKFEDLSN